jgi:hypothetical protein
VLPRAGLCLDLAAETAAACTYAQLKQRATEAVRKRDLRVTRRSSKSMVYCLWSILGQPELYPNACQQYLAGMLSAGQHMKFLCRSGMLLVGHRRHQLRQATTPACAYCRSCSDATPAHALLQCSAFSAQREAFWQSFTCVLEVATAAELRELPADHQLLYLLGDAEWGHSAVGVDAVVQHYLWTWQAAQAQSEAVAGGVGRVDQSCQVCMGRDGPTMLLCDECDDGYDMKCLVPRLYRVQHSSCTGVQHSSCALVRCLPWATWVSSRQPRQVPAPARQCRMAAGACSIACAPAASSVPVAAATVLPASSSVML